MANKPTPADFSPTVPDFPSIGQYQPIYGKFDLTTYIQGASDYEIMAFLVQCYNATLKGYGDVTKLSKDTVTAYNQLQIWVNTWFENLDVQKEINDKLQEMYENGSLAEAVASSNVIIPAMERYLNTPEGTQNLSNVTASKIDSMAKDGSLADVVAQTDIIPDVAKEYLGSVEGLKDLSDATAQKIEEMAKTGALGAVIANTGKVQSTTTNWLQQNVTPKGSAVVVDKSLTIADAAADAKIVGERINPLTNGIALSGVRTEYININAITANTFYTGANTTTSGDSDWSVFSPLQLKSGKYYIINVSTTHSYVTTSTGSVTLKTYTGNEDVLNKMYEVEFGEDVTVYLSLYNINRYYPHLSNSPITLTAEHGQVYFLNDDNNRIKSIPWCLGSFSLATGAERTNYFDDSFNYITSLDFVFPYDVYVVNANPGEYLYYIAYNVPQNNTDYSNDKTKMIPANTKFRIGVKYTDNRTLTVNEGIELVTKALTLTINLPFWDNKTDANIITNIITVGIGKQYATIQEAVASITNSRVNNRYTVLVYEGTYDITSAGISFIPIKPYVTIKGVDKSKCIIKFQPNEKDADKNVFQQSYDFTSGYGEVCNFTIVTENIKGALHLDNASWKGEIHFHDVIINDISGEEVYNPSLDYYWYFRASVGAINLATHIGQKIVIENVQTNGYIYSHSSTSAINDLNNENGGTFIVRNCVCDWIGVYGNGDAVRKNCIIEDNKCQHITISFSDANNLGFMCWNTMLNNNNIDFVAMQYLPYGHASLDNMQNLADKYYGCYPNADPNIHKVVQNNSEVDIPLGSKVKFTDYRHREVTINNQDYDAIACQTIKTGGYGVVQDGGNKEVYLRYLSTHELAK